MLALSKTHTQTTIFAPNIEQFHTVNHLTGEETSEPRNVLIESSRIARGEIFDISEIDSNKLDALIIPGGFGVAKNLSDFAFKGTNSSINTTVKELILNIHQQKKPIGAICISPAVISLLIKGKVTIGNDLATAQVIEKLGATHINSNAEDVVIDRANKIVSTPAFMTNAPLFEIYEGIEKCINEVIELI